MTLQSLAWTVFDSDTPDDATINQFIQSVQVSQKQDSGSDPATATNQSLESSQSTASKPARARMNTKIRSATSVYHHKCLTLSLLLLLFFFFSFCFSVTSIDVDSVADTFWERNFDTDDEVPWYKFQQAFLTDFDSQLKSKF